MDCAGSDTAFRMALFSGTISVSLYGKLYYTPTGFLLPYKMVYKDRVLQGQRRKTRSPIPPRASAAWGSPCSILMGQPWPWSAANRTPSAQVLHDSNPTLLLVSRDRSHAG